MTKICKHCGHGKSYHATRTDLVIRDLFPLHKLSIKKVRKEMCLVCQGMELAEARSGEIDQGSAFCWSREIIPFHKFGGSI